MCSVCLHQTGKTMIWAQSKTVVRTNDPKAQFCLNISRWVLTSTPTGSNRTFLHTDSNSASLRFNTSLKRILGYFSSELKQISWSITVSLSCLLLRWRCTHCSRLKINPILTLIQGCDSVVLILVVPHGLLWSVSVDTFLRVVTAADDLPGDPGWQSAQRLFQKNNRRHVVKSLI